MSGLAFVTHPSVRIRGSENVYTPVQCLDEQCFIKTAHLHCPFCVKTDSYTDPVILKAHYRVKHVDKGIEFAGLKILRCCDHCDIVGVIKGEKKFKGAHWHCYRCRNGFNRRDEAIKHYKTHFRNPQTTFQISITQDLNNPVAYNTESKSAPQTPVSTSASNSVSTNSIHPALTEAISSVSSPGVVSEQDVTSSNAPLCNGKMGSEEQTSEVVEEDEQQQAIVIIEEGQLRTSDMDTFTAHVIDIENVNAAEKKSSEKKIADDRARLEKRLRQVTEEKEVLVSEVARLHRNVTKLEESLRQSRKREVELVSRLGNATERSTAELLKRMEQEHRNLLRQHLDTLHNYVLTSQSPTTSAVLQLTDQHGQEIQVVNASSLEAFFAGNITSSSEVRTSLPTAIIQASDLSLEEVVASEAAEVVESTDVPVSDVELTTNYVMCIQNLKTEKENEDDDELSPKVTFSTSTVALPSHSPARKKRKVN